MTNIQEIEKEIMQLQENIEAALNELHKPRGLLAKYTKFETEILGPNKDLTNIESEIKEAEEFLSEDQINIIKSIVTEPDTYPSKSSGSNNDNDKWNNLRPTLRSLGLVRELDISKENEVSDSEDSLSDDEDNDEDLDELDDDEDEEDDDGEDHDTDIDLECIRKRRKKFKRKMRNLKRKKLLETNSNVKTTTESITTEIIEAIVIDENELKSDKKIDNTSQPVVEIIQESVKTNNPTTSTSDNAEPDKETSKGNSFLLADYYVYCLNKR